MTALQVAVTGTSWCATRLVHEKLDRVLRTTPGMTLVTQLHFLVKVSAWARRNKVPVTYVDARNRYTANAQLLEKSAFELTVFDRDRYVDHLVQVAKQRDPRLPIRHYHPE